MSKCVVFAAGPCNNPARLAHMISPDDFLIAADAGWALAQKMELKPDVLVADFDSMDPPRQLDNVKLINLPVKKDDTDTAVAIKEGYNAGYRSFLLLGCTGGRLDHQHAALTVAAQYAQKGCRMVLADEQNEIHILAPGRYVFPSTPGDNVSFFAFGGEVTNLRGDGLMYKVDGFSLSPYNPLCVSNAAQQNDFSIEFDSGILLLYVSKD